MKKALFFFPHNPFPPKSGAHHRCLSMLKALKALGYRVVFVSTDIWTDSDWHEESEAALREKYCDASMVYHQSWSDRFSRRIWKTVQPRPSLGNKFWIPHQFKSWFRSICRKHAPELLIMNYAYWDDLLDSEIRSSARTLIDCHDLVSILTVNEQKLWKEIGDLPISEFDISSILTDESYWRTQEHELSAEETEIYDRYDCTIAISPKDRDLLSERCKFTNTAYLPATYAPAQIESSFTGPVVFPIGPNPLNVQAYAYFAVKVLPKVVSSAPDFALKVTGTWSKKMFPAPNISLEGFVPELEQIYKDARFLICPSLVGTGQQIKVVEAMSRGIPCVIHQAVSASAPIQHGINGFVAANAEAFAEYCVKLWSDPSLCSRLGYSARETVVRDFSEEQLVRRLEKLV